MRSRDAISSVRADKSVAEKASLLASPYETRPIHRVQFVMHQELYLGVYEAIQAPPTFWSIRFDHRQFGCSEQLSIQPRDLRKILADPLVIYQRL